MNEYELNDLSDIIKEDLEDREFAKDLIRDALLAPTDNEYLLETLEMLGKVHNLPELLLEMQTCN